MNALVQAWSRLSLQKQVIVGLAAVVTFAAVLGIARLAPSTQMSLLYAGLDPMAAGEVLKALDQDGAAYEVRGAAIYVDSAKRDSLRMTLAAQGLPASNGQGYELLDSLSGFGTTAQMFDAAYWRAREGELARTILSSPDVRAARVHISAQSGRPFDRDFRPTASVAVTPAGAPVTKEFARAMRFLVASAVSGLKPEDVSVIDSRTGVVIGGESPVGTDPSDRAEALRKNVQRLLEARVGPGRSVVEVSVEVTGETESIHERQIDPKSRVQISTETQERNNTASDTNNPGVTVASNLPSGDGAAQGKSDSKANESRERVNYDVSETRREVTRGPGEISRISVAVLVDGIRTTDAAGATTWAPRDEAELQALRELVASAVGYSEDRKDSITIKSMEFEPVAELGTEATSASTAWPIDPMRLAQLGVFAAVALVLGLFVVRPALTASAPPPGLPAPSLGSGSGLPALAEVDGPALTGTVDDGTDMDIQPGMAMVTADMADFGPLPDLQSNPVERLRQLVQDRREETMEILRSWVEEPEETA